MAVLGIAGALVFSGCSSTGEQTSNVSTPSTPPSNNNVVTSQNRAGSDVQPVAGNANSQPEASADSVVARTNSLQRKIDAAKNSSVGGKVDLAELAKQNSRPAPENSTFTSFLAESGYEIRTFKNHPQLLKVEKKTSADGNQSVKVFLRGGRVIDLPGQSLSPLSTVSSTAILDAIGQGAPPTVKEGSE